MGSVRSVWTGWGLKIGLDLAVLAAIVVGRKNLSGVKSDRRHPRKGTKRPNPMDPCATPSLKPRCGFGTVILC